MTTRRWVWGGIALCVLGVLGWTLLRHGSAAPRQTISIIYSADLGGRLSAADGNGHNLSDVAARVASLRKDAVEQGGGVLLVDLGGSLNGVGPFNAAQRSVPMATAMKAVGYDAVLPDERDLWTGRGSLEQLQQAGGFKFVLANAADSPFKQPVIRTFGSLRIAVYGVYAPPHVWMPDEEAPPPDLVVDRNLVELKTSIAHTAADVHVVLAAVRDADLLARQLPPSVVVIPADGAAHASSPRLAPSLELPRQIGRISISVAADGSREISFALDNTAVGSTDPAVESAVRSARTAFDRAAPPKSRVAQATLAYAEAQASTDEPGSAIADTVSDTLRADVCILAPGEALAVKGGVLSEAGLAHIVDRAARVRVVWASGAEVLGWLQEKMSKDALPPISGVTAWRGNDGRLVLALHDGTPLSDCKRLRVAVSTRLGGAPPASGRSLLEVVRTALHTRPYLASASARWFVADAAAVAESAALLARGGELATDHPSEAESLWVQALERKPDESTARALETTMQTSMPHRFPSYLQLAALEERAGCWQLAWNALQMGRTGYGDRYTFPLAQARLLILHGLPLAASPLLKQAAALGAPPADVALLGGLQCLMVGDAAGADRSFTAALDSVDDADQTRYRALTGLARMRHGDARGAVTVLTAPRPRPTATPAEEAHLDAAVTAQP